MGTIFRYIADEVIENAGIEGACPLCAETKRVYALLGQADHMDMYAFDDRHAFSQPRREAAARWMRRWLLDDATTVSEPELKTQSMKSLQVTESGQVLREFRDAVSVSDLNLQRARELASRRATFWKSRTSRRLRC